MAAINHEIWIQGARLQSAEQAILGKRILTYELKDRVVLISGLTGAIDQLAPQEYSEMKNNLHEFITNYPSLADELACRGYIFENRDTETQFENRLTNYIESESSKKEIVFMMCPTDFCPVGCNYCFAEERVLEAKRDVMSLEMIDSAFRSMAEIQSKYPSRLSTMCLYGGEPFQDFTREALEHIFARSRKMGLRIAAFTSGLYTFKFKDLLAEYRDNIQTIAVTLDGTEATKKCTWCNNGY